MTTGSSPDEDSKANFTSDNTQPERTWATINGPRSPAASLMNRCPSISRTPAFTGSLRAPGVKKAHCRQYLTEIRGSPASWVTLFSNTNGEPTACSTTPCSIAAVTTCSVIAEYTSSNVSKRSYRSSKLVARDSSDAVGCCVRTN